MTEALPDQLVGALRKGEIVLVFSHCRHQYAPGIVALTSDRVLFLAGPELELSLAQRVAQSRRIRVRDQSLTLKSGVHEVTFTDLDRGAIQEIVGTLGRKVKVSDPEIAQRVKAHRKRVKRRALGCILKVPKEVLAPAATASTTPS